MNFLSKSLHFFTWGYCFLSHFDGIRDLCKAFGGPSCLHVFVSFSFFRVRFSFFTSWGEIGDKNGVGYCATV
jgi:hypothetical protein